MNSTKRRSMRRTRSAGSGRRSSVGSSAPESIARLVASGIPVSTDWNRCPAAVPRIEPEVRYDAVGQRLAGVIIGIPRSVPHHGAVVADLPQIHLDPAAEGIREPAELTEQALAARVYEDAGF